MIILSLGSNLSSNYGNRFDNIKKAVSFLNEYNIFVHKKSSYYETPSYPNKNNPKFINIVVTVKTKLLPFELMSILIQIEEKLERKRNKKNDPRTCDIDIIDYNQEIISFTFKKQKLEIPHIHLKKRNFVLYPLSEILPDWKHPVSKEKISYLIKKLSEDDKNSISKIRKIDIL